MSLAWFAARRTLRSLPMWALGLGLSTSTLLGLVFWGATAGGRSVSSLTLMSVVWVGVAVYLAASDVRTRCTPFDMTLPVGTRALWFNGLLATVAGGLAIVAVNVGIVTLFVALLTGPTVERYGLLTLLLGSGLVLAALLLRAPRPSLFRVPPDAGQVLWTIVVLAGTLVLMAAALASGVTGSLALVAVTALVAAYTYRRVPSSYVLVPAEPLPDPSRASPSWGVPSFGSRVVLQYTVLRSISGGAKELLAVPIIVVFALLLGGALSGFEAGSLRELRFIYLPMTTYMLFAMTGPRLAALQYLDPMPLSRKPLTAALLAPYLVVLCAGYGAGWLVASVTSRGPQWVDFAETKDGYRVTVPLRVYGAAEEGETPRVSSSWGEVHDAETCVPYRGSAMSLYNPYSTPSGSSRRFVALQLSRAFEAVYGISVPPETIDRRDLVTLEDGSVAPRGGSLSVREADSSRKPRSGPMAPVLLALTIVPWLLLTALLLRAYRSSIREWVRQSIVWGSLALMLVFVIATSALTTFRIVEPWVLRAMVEIPVMTFADNPAGSVAVWILCLAAIAAAYALVGRQFARMEIPAEPSRYTLLRPREG
jgi:hypothetical protein